METPSNSNSQSRMTRTVAKRGLDWRFPRSQTYPIKKSWQKEAFSEWRINPDSASTAPNIAIVAIARDAPMAQACRPFSFRGPFG